MSDQEPSPTPEVPPADGTPPPGGYAPPPPGYTPPPPGYPPPAGYPSAPPVGYGPPSGYGLPPYDPNAPVHPSGPNDTLWAVLSHLSFFVLALIFPLIVMLTAGQTSHFVKRHSTEALNFHISLAIYGVVAFVLIFAFIGFVLLPAVAIFGTVMTIIAAIAAGKGQDYRYPLCIRLVK